MVSPGEAGGSGLCARVGGGAGQELREIALGDSRRAGLRAKTGADRDAVFYSGAIADIGTERDSDAGCARRYCYAVEKQFAVCGLGVAGDVVAGAGARLQNLADAAAV